MHTLSSKISLFHSLLAFLYKVLGKEPFLRTPVLKLLVTYRLRSVLFCSVLVLQQVVIGKCQKRSDNEGVHLYPYRSGRNSGRKCMLGAVLSRAWHSGMSQSRAIVAILEALSWFPSKMFCGSFPFFFVNVYVFQCSYIRFLFLFFNRPVCSLMDRCPVIRLLEVVMMPSTRFSLRPALGSMFLVLFSWIWSPP